jgi:hypothetical protein
MLLENSIFKVYNMSWKKVIKKNIAQQVRDGMAKPYKNPAVQGSLDKQKQRQQIEEQIRNLQEEFNKKKAELESRKRDLESSQMFHN